MVDLDGARTGRPVARDSLLEITRSVGVPIQAGGGIRTLADVEELLGAGVARVVLGTAALKNPELAAEMAEMHPGKVAVGLDHRGGGREVALAGWEAGSGLSLDGALGLFETVPLASVVVTSIDRDGTLEGPDSAGLASCLELTRHDVVASGGVSSMADLRALAAMEVAGRRLAGVVVGKAILEGLVDLEEALALCEASG